VAARCYSRSIVTGATPDMPRQGATDEAERRFQAAASDCPRDFVEGPAARAECSMLSVLAPDEDLPHFAGDCERSLAVSMRRILPVTIVLAVVPNGWVAAQQPAAKDFEL
jgi:hypothetical protein